MENSQSDKTAQLPFALPPPPPPLTLAPPVIQEHSYTLHYEKKHQRMINGEAQYSDQKEQIEAKYKNKFSAAEESSHESQSTGDKLSRNLEICQKCHKCGHWIQKDEMKIHMTFHVAPVFDNLLLGDKHSCSSRKELFVRNKVTHILNAAAELKNYFQSEGVVYCNLKLGDQIGQDVIDEAIKGAQFIDKSMREGGVVFVHCAVGQSRSVACIIMYLMLYRNMNYADSLALIKVTRPIARPNLTYREQLQQFSDKRAQQA